MCWNAPVSFATFAIGTVLNVASFRALRGSGVAPVVWAWQYALLMQLPEGAAWLDGAAEAPARAAFLLNVTQPLAAHLAVRVARATAGGVDRGIVALVMFYALLVTDLGELVDGSRSIAAGDGCPHLRLAYWDGSRGTLYVVASLFVFSDLPDLVWALVNAGIFLVSLAISSAWFSCGLGSVWCWSVAFASPVLVAVHYARLWYGTSHAQSALRRGTLREWTRSMTTSSASTSSRSASSASAVVSASDAAPRKR